MFSNIPPALLVVQLLLIGLPPLVAQTQARTQPATAEERAQQTTTAALERMAVGDAAAAITVLRSTAGSSPVPLLAQRAQCLMGAAFAMNGEVHATEEAAGILNNPAAGAAQAVWKQVLPECVRLLQGISPRLSPEKRAGLYYYLGLIGNNEVDHIRFLRDAHKLRPDFSEVGYQLGVHLLANGELEEAGAVFRRVAEQRPEWAEPRNNLGVALTLLGRSTEAIREFQEALKVKAEFPEAHGRLGLALYITGDYDNALVHCSRAVRDQPENPFHYNCAAVVLVEKGRTTDALAYARRASELAPTHETFQVVLAVALLANGQEQEAQAAMSRALAAHPTLRTDSTRLEKAHLLRSRALTLARQLLEKSKK